MTDQTLALLVESMKQNGFMPEFPIVRQRGEILDGRLRYAAALEAGVEPVFAEYDGDDSAAYVKAANLTRRHGMTAEQIVQTFLKLQPELENREIARQTGASLRTIQRARTLREKSPELADQVMIGTSSAYAARRLVGHSHTGQPLFA